MTGCSRAFVIFAFSTFQWFFTYMHANMTPFVCLFVFFCLFVCLFICVCVRRCLVILAAFHFFVSCCVCVCFLYIYIYIMSLTPLHTLQPSPFMFFLSVHSG